MLSVGAAASAVSIHAASEQTPITMKDIRYVIFHRPGPAWQPGKSMFEQPGVMQHVQHYRQWLVAGKLELGGPHLDAAGGGMMIPVAGILEDEVRRFAFDDPAVKDSTLLVEVRPWLIGMSK
jgi:hypothetical protein